MPQAKKTSIFSTIAMRRSVGIKDKSYFFHLLAVMLDSGVPIIKALSLLSKKTSNEHFAEVIMKLGKSVEGGSSLSSAMNVYPNVFKASEVGVIKSGEVIGNLPHLLFRLSRQTERLHSLMMKVRGALVYPSTVLVALLVSGFVVVTLVIPRLNDFFEQSDFVMPLLTRIVLSIGEFAINFFWFLVIAAAAFVLLAMTYFQTENGKRSLDLFLMKAPVFSGIVSRLHVSRLIQILSLLVEAGVPIHEAIQITGESSSSPSYRDFMMQLRARVERGERMALVMEEQPLLFPEMVVAMISVGENTGQLALISEKIALHYERELEHSLHTFTTVLEPLVTVLVGLLVGLLALALLGPIFSLSSLVV